MNANDFLKEMLKYVRFRYCSPFPRERKKVETSHRGVSESFKQEAQSHLPEKFRQGAKNYSSSSSKNFPIGISQLLVTHS